MHPCEDDIVCKCTTEENKVPYFNAPVYLENKEQIGKVDEIFGQLRDFYFSVKLSENMKASSFKKLQKFYIDPYKLLPLQRFLPRPPGEKGPPPCRSKLLSCLTWTTANASQLFSLLPLSLLYNPLCTPKSESKSELIMSFL